MRRLAAAICVVLVSSTAHAQGVSTHWVGTWGAAAAWRPPSVGTRTDGAAGAVGSASGGSNPSVSPGFDRSRVSDGASAARLAPGADAAPELFTRVSAAAEFVSR